MHKKGGLQQVLSNHAEKIRLKLLGRPLKQMKATLIFPSSEREQNKVLESMSPEYKYQDSENAASQNKHNQDNQISNILDETTVHDLAAKHLLDSESQHSTRAGTPGLMKGFVGSRGGVESLEQLNIMLQNTLPEYQYDRAERGPGFSFDGCVDLDPDCWKYELHGLCSDSPDLAEKRFNCKKTCHLCV
ncbi:Hypothetical predicted protein, partial [Paramuricea clavata]